MRVKQFNTSVGTQIFKAFSELARVRVINLLFKKGPLSTSDLELVLEFTQAKTSRHLVYLKTSGLVSSKRIDQWVLYSVNDEFGEIITQLLNYFEKDPLLKNDLETCDVLNSNRELSTSKINLKKLMREKL
ncbi:helix-turn-helix transcriptional regulator [Hyphobacterium sp. CCMP332]|nr:helix-turn-helix transcriptional regulator [Hyphobacterium sp. CCMP332]